MKPVSELRRREVAAFFEFVSKLREMYDTEAEIDNAINCLSSHVLSTYEHEDYMDLSRHLLELDSSASFVFLGREASERAETIEALHSDGHEIVQHGHRHVRWGDLDYDTAYENLSKGIAEIRDNTGIEAVGLFVPFKSISEAGLRAAADSGIEWVLGDASGDIPESLTLVESIYPHDTRLLEEGTSPERTFEQFRDQAEDGSTFLFHPNMVEYHGGTPEFEDWIADTQPVTVREQLRDGGVAAVMDAIRPFRVE